DEPARRVAEESHRPFDLARGPVLRVRLFTRADRDRTLLVTFHHIAYDLWSMMTLLDELGVFYRSHAGGEPPSLAPPRPYDEFVRWQADMLAGPQGERLWSYWGAQMAGDIPALALPGDLSGDPPFTTLLDRMRQVVLGALEHQDYPFALLVERLRPKRDPSHSTLFHAIFALNKPHRREDQSIAVSIEEGAGRLDLGGLVLELCHSAQQAVVDD